MTSSPTAITNEMSHNKLQDLVNSKAVHCQPWPKVKGSSQATKENPFFSTKNPLKKWKFLGAALALCSPKGLHHPHSYTLLVLLRDKADLQPVKNKKKSRQPIRSKPNFSSITWYPTTIR